MPSTITRSAFLAGLALIVALPAFLAVPASAVESQGIGAIPARPREDNPRTKSIFVYTAKPNSVTTDAIKLINNTDQERTVRVYAVDSQRSSDGAFACAQAADAKKEVGSWLTLAQNEVTLPPNANKEVSFTVTVPANATTGEHNGCIAIEDVKGATQQSGNGIVLSFRSALRVAITVPGKIEANLAFSDLVINDEEGKLVVSPVLKNTGNVSVDALVRTSLNSLFGTTVTSSEGTFVVLNQDESRFNFELERPFWGGWYTLSNKAEYSILQERPAGASSSRSAEGESRTVFIAPHPTARFIYAVSLVAIIAVVTYLLWQRRRFKLMHQTTVRYTVKQNDNLQTLAENSATSWRNLAKLNNLKAPYTLAAGDVLHIPPKTVRSRTKSNKLKQ